MSEKIVSLHAADMYAERIMGVVPPEGKQFSFEKIEGIQILILKILIECHPMALTLGEGTFDCVRYDCRICMQGGVVTTIKEFNHKDRKRYNGGIMKSGKKVKKSKTSDVGPRTKTVKRTRDEWWQQDF